MTLCEWYFRVPTQLSRRKEQDKVKSMIGRAHFIDAPQPSSSQAQDDVPRLSGLLSITRNDDCNLSTGSSRKVVATPVTVLVETQRDLAVMVRRQISCELMSLPEKLNRGVVAKQHVLQNLHGVPIQCLINWVVHADVESVLGIPNVQLTIGGISSRLGEKSASNVMESTFDLIHPRTSSTTIEVMLHIQLNPSILAHRGEGKSRVVATDVLSESSCIEDRCW